MNLSWIKIYTLDQATCNRSVAQTITLEWTTKLRASPKVKPCKELQRDNKGDGKP